MRKARRSDQSGPTRLSAAASAPPAAAPPTPASEMRELALTRVKPVGSSRGTAAARVTPYAREATRQPRAAGKSHGRGRRHGTGQHPGEEGPQGQRRTDRPAAAVTEPVEQRADERGHDGERRHREQRGTGPPGRVPARSGRRRRGCRPGRRPGLRRRRCARRAARPAGPGRSRPPRRRWCSGAPAGHPTGSRGRAPSRFPGRRGRLPRRGGVGRSPPTRAGRRPCRGRHRWPARACRLRPMPLILPGGRRR